MTDRSPVRVCIVGTARRSWKDADGHAPEPLLMWEEVTRQAIADIGTTHDVIAELDHLGVVHTQSWDYDDPAARLAERLGAHPCSGTYSILAGTSPQRLLNEAAAAMVRGEISAAVVVGAEAQATVRRATAAGETLDWSHPHPSPARVTDLLSEWYLPTELRHGVLPAWLTFALLSQARWAARGGRAEDRRAMYEQMSRLSAVAGASEHAWYRTEHSAERLATADAANRMIATPFTKLTTAFPYVDMAAANVLVTDEVADRWGVPADRRVHLRGWGFARDASHIAARTDLTSSPAMRVAMGSATSMAGVELEEIDLFDFYSCFGTAVQFARDAAGLADDDPRPVSLTGGLPYHGGPGSNYMSHSISALVERLRAGDGRLGMVTGIGMHMTKHVAGIWSIDPGERPLSDSTAPLETVLPEAPDAFAVLDAVVGPVVVDAASAVHDASGAATSVTAICTTVEGARCYARSEDPEVIEAVVEGRWVGLAASVVAGEDGINRLRFG
ncbi:MAG: acetyl-CoA synthetase [Acidobacteria bacterium]|nr:acetyl-CoA synthetase [Acidobacteriota bacterium]